ncbi:MAG: carbohydrate ABC transporter permease [Propionibacteriaceae bacterium]|nr:carbohydrate ABC transporter permease [Propionibacteriaceae bacterium]
MDESRPATGRVWYLTAISVLFVMAYLFPIYWMVATSLKGPGDLLAIPPKVFPWPFDLAAWQQNLTGGGMMLRSILNSTVVALGTTALSFVLGVAAAYGLAQLRGRLSRVLVFFTLAAQLIPGIILAGPFFLALARIGLLDSYVGLILANTTFTLPFAIMVMRPFFLGVPRELPEAALTDGCNQVQALLRIVIPVVRPGLITVGIFNFLSAWGEFQFAYTLTSSETMATATVFINSFQGQYGIQYNALMAASTAVSIPIIIAIVLLQKYVSEGLAAGSVKD